MTDLSQTLSAATTIYTMQYDNATGALLLGVQGVGLQSLDLQTDSFVTLASSYTPSGVDITPDGQYALVTGSGASPNLIDRVNLSTNAVETLTLGSTSAITSFSDLVVAANGKAIALVNGGSLFPAVEFDAEAATPVPTSVAVGGAARLWLAPSEDRQYVVMYQTSASGPGSDPGIMLYRSSTDSVVGFKDIDSIAGSVPQFPLDFAAISDAAGLIFWGGFVLDTQLNVVKDLSASNTYTDRSPYTAIIDAQFSADGHELFLWNRVLGEVQVYDTAGWRLVGQVATTITPLYGLNSPWISMTASNDGRFLFLGADAHLQVIDLSADLHLTVYGDASHTQLYGEAGSDLLIAGPGNAVMTGQGGADVFRITSGSANATVTDFSHAQGDHIDLSLFGFVSLSDVLAASTQSGANTVISLGSGTLTLDNVAMASLTAQDFVFHKWPSDFGQSGQDAVVFRNASTGDWGFMTANASGGETWHHIGGSSTDYVAIGKGDFNGDGVLDVAFRQTSTGNWGFLTVNPSGGETWQAVGPSSLGYDAVATGDILANGSTDIVFRNPTTGDWGFMSASGSNPILTGSPEAWHPIGSTSTDYSVIGSGDFNGDGVFDVAFRQNSTGDWGFLSINPGGGETWHFVGASSLAYQAVASASFLGDGMTQIAFRDPATGNWGFMQANAAGGETWHPIGSTSTDYTVIGNGDFNGDGVQDVAFRQAATGDWGYLTVNPTGGQTWHFVGSSSLAYGTI